MIDLHAHTTASDGTFSPRDLVLHAREIGISHLAITDHDTAAACEEAALVGREAGVRVVPGIELSVEDTFGDTFARFHLLGYFCDPNSKLLREDVPFLQRERDKRNREVLQVLASAGMPISYEELQAIGGNQIGRPHIAQLLKEKGHVTSTQQAFDLYLDSGRPAYRAKLVMKARDAVAAIRAAGGVAVWAHPADSRKRRSKEGVVSEKYSWPQMDEMLRAWISWGLDGLEAHYPTYDEADIEWTRRAAREDGLIASGGSDFHGTRKVNRLGDCGPSGAVPEEVLGQIATLAKERGSSAVG
jgi:predicted metal-dependent phosphoesterase TrpH